MQTTFLNSAVSNFTHPELQKGEIFFTNANTRAFKWMKWKSKRKGILAYDGEGRPTGRRKSDWFPVFLKVSELEAIERPLQEIRQEIRSFINIPY